jgi:hypothetical protein
MVVSLDRALAVIEGNLGEKRVDHMRILQAGYVQFPPE